MGQPRGIPGKRAALASTIILVPFLIIFVVFAAHFYRVLVKYNYERSASQIRELEGIASELEIHTNNRVKISTISSSQTIQNVWSCLQKLQRSQGVQHLLITISDVLTNAIEAVKYCIMKDLIISEFAMKNLVAKLCQSLYKKVFAFPINYHRHWVPSHWLRNRWDSA